MRTPVASLRRRTGLPGSAAILLAFLFNASSVNAEEATDAPGAKIFAQKCADCHGAQGEGTADYPDPLVGDRSVRELADVIARTMPEGDPEECAGEEAEQVARYVHEAFYSRIAQDRNRPATIEFSRLTVRQYENAVADLIGNFAWRGKWDDERGLSGEYFNSRRLSGKENRVIQRTDPVVNFQFGEDVPDGYPGLTGEEKKKREEEQKKKEEEAPPPRDFSIRWNGSIFAPETGEYEFIVETENGTRLWVNDTDRALIDAWVQSGDQTEHRESIRLLGGRVYPLRLEFFRYREKTASIRLKWKRPHHSEEAIPERFLTPHRWPQTFVLNTPFPPDDRSIGYERGSAISKEWTEAVTYAALEVAGFVASNLDRLADTKGDAGDRAKKIREFCYRFAEGAFRRPLTDEQRHFFIDRQFEKSDSPELAVKRVVLLTLKSPRFLYRETGLSDFDAPAVAAWMSFTLWDSLPDKQLTDAAADGRLETREQVELQAERMIGDLRTRAKVREFLHQWLKLEEFPDLAKDAELYPRFDERVVSDLRTSLNLFLDEVVWSRESDFRQLLLADYVYLNGRLGRIYGADLPDEADFEKVPLAEQQRAGVLSHPLLMAGFAYDKSSSPIHRGVFLSRSLLGRRLKPPPEAVSPLSPDLHEALSTRERVTLQTGPATCQSCHAMIDPLGFSLEHFDALGRYREKEKGREIDASGHYLDRSGETTGFRGSRELAAFLAECPETHVAFAEQLFQYTVKQPVRAFGQKRLEELRDSFASNGFNIKSLLREIVTTSVMTAREIKSTETVSADQP